MMCCNLKFCWGPNLSFSAGLLFKFKHASEEKKNNYTDRLTLLQYPANLRVRVLKEVVLEATPTSRDGSVLCEPHTIALSSPGTAGVQNNSSPKKLMP